MKDNMNLVNMLRNPVYHDISLQAGPHECTRCGMPVYTLASILYSKELADDAKAIRAGLGINEPVACVKRTEAPNES
jgi:hypothetical protein